MMTTNRWTLVIASVLALLVIGVASFRLVYADATIPIDFAKNPGADVSEAEIKAALDKVNAVFKTCGITFTFGSFIPITPTKPITNPAEAGENKPTKDMKDVESYGTDAVKTAGRTSKVVVIIVENFKNPNGGQRSSINGIAGGGNVLIADPFHVGFNTMGGEEFWHTLAHELGHVLGLSHILLASDVTATAPKGSEYQSPNLMAKDGAFGNDQLTKDQCEELKKNAPKFVPKGK